MNSHRMQKPLNPAWCAKCCSSVTFPSKIPRQATRELFRARGCDLFLARSFEFLVALGAFRAESCELVLAWVALRAKGFDSLFLGFGFCGGVAYVEQNGNGLYRSPVRARGYEHEQELLEPSFAHQASSAVGSSLQFPSSHSQGG